jgi:hypothetical protein
MGALLTLFRSWLFQLPPSVRTTGANQRKLLDIYDDIVTHMADITMSSLAEASWPSWRQIAKVIRKRLGDKWNDHPRCGPSGEERRNRRLADARMGFTSFDDFEEVEI